MKRFPHEIAKNSLELKIPIGHLMATSKNLLPPQVCEMDFFYRDCKQIFIL